MRPIAATWAIALCLLALSGCGGAKKDAGAKADAAGEILPRSVSDDMLPYDTVRSQPPLLAPEKGSDDGGSGKASASEAASGDAAVAAPDTVSEPAAAAVKPGGE